MKPGDRPKLILLASKTSVNHYESLPIEVKKELSQIQIISFWHSRLKQPDSFHGLGRSILKVMDSLHINKKNRIMLLGYGKTGKGIGYYLHQNGFTIQVVDTDPTELVIALHDGFAIGNFMDVAKNADVVIDATGGVTETINQTTANYFTQPKVTILSTSTHDQDISIPNGYKNKNGTLFIVHPSHGMVNMHHKIGGSDDEAMRVTGYSLLYTVEHYPLSSDDVLSENKYLEKFSPAFEKKIATDFLRQPQLLGGPPLPEL